MAAVETTRSHVGSPAGSPMSADGSPTATQSGRRAIVLGGTGAVGTALIHELIAEPSVSEVTLLLRRDHPDAAIAASSKVRQIHVDVFDPSSYAAHVPGHDMAFSTLGVGKPGDMPNAEFTRIDHDCPLAFANQCRQSGVPHFSSLGAVGTDSSSRIFRIRQKGLLEDALRELQFPRLSLFKPSLIITPTNRYDFKHGVMLKVMPLVDVLLIGSTLRQFRSVRVEELGAVMAWNAVAEPTAAVEALTRADYDRIRDAHAAAQHTTASAAAAPASARAAQTESK